MNFHVPLITRYEFSGKKGQYIPLHFTKRFRTKFNLLYVRFDSYRKCTAITKNIYQLVG